MEKLITVIGPTASGKTTLAMHLAGVFGGELINADSRQVYREMNIGTDKVKSTTKKLKLHLIDVAEPNEQFTVAEYKKLAIQTINDIQGRKKLPILVGGTGLYIKAVVENLEFPSVPAQKELRAELEEKHTEELYEMVKKFDKKTAEIIDRYNKHRLIRALEVSIVSHKPFSSQKSKGKILYNALQIGYDIPQDVLFQNIETRVQEMVKQGLEEEVRTLVKKYGWTNVLSNSIGYKEWKGCLEGEKARGVAREIIRNTKSLARKQLTWFRAQRGIKWVKDIQEAQLLVKQFIAS